MDTRDRTGLGPRYLGICYHYVRPPKREDPFPRLLGTCIDEFRRQIQMLSQGYKPITLGDARRFSYDSRDRGSARDGVLITFDDGLSDQYRAAQILAEHGIQGAFFVPTCILMDREPANPTIIHYAIAIHGIDAFLTASRRTMEQHGLATHGRYPRFRKGVDDPWETIARIKAFFKYTLSYADARRALLHIYRELLVPRDPNMLSIMHLTVEQVREIVAMGHAIGVHSHSHISLDASRLSDAVFQKELLEPKRYLERTFGVTVNAFSYPFGAKRDCLTADQLLARTRAFELAFTVRPVCNTKAKSPLELGRYMVTSQDTVRTLKDQLRRIAQEDGGTP